MAIEGNPLLSAAAWLHGPDSSNPVPTLPSGRVVGGFARAIHRHKCARCGDMTEEGKWRRKKNATTGKSMVVCLDCFTEMGRIGKAMEEAKADAAGQEASRKKNRKPACPKGRERKWAHHLVQEKPGQPFVCADCGFEWVDPETSAIKSIPAEDAGRLAA